MDIFVSSVGTGGTITGTGAYLKSQNADIKVVAVEPHDSPVLSGGRPGPHRIQGIGAGFVPAVLDTSVYDEVMQAKSEDAFRVSRALSRAEGLLVGISSGAALWAATELAKRRARGQTIVALLPDTGERYLSAPSFLRTDTGHEKSVNPCCQTDGNAFAIGLLPACAAHGQRGALFASKKPCLLGFYHTCRYKAS